MTASKLVFLGLDGATWDVVQPWIQAGQLPTLASLVERGATSRLTSTIPAVTPAAWPSIYTGVNPGKHGVFAFQRRVAGEYRWVASTADDVARTPFWDLAGEQGARAAVLFAPYTWPARIANGVLVAGRGAPTGTVGDRSAPAKLSSELGSRFGVEQLFGARRPPNATLGDIRRGLVASIRAQADAIEEVLTKDAYDVVAAVWDQTDTAAHLFWHHSEPCPDIGSPMFEIYREVDTALGRVLAACGNDGLVVVCSDHGAYPITHRVRMPLWLAERGHLSLQTSMGATMLARAGTAWLKLPESVRRAVPKRARRGIGARHEATFRQNRLVDWSRTQVYPEPVVAEALHLNRRGREPQGIVEEAAGDGVLSRLEEDLKAMEAPDGRRLVSTTLRGADIYTGPHAGAGPDLVVETVRGVYLSPTPAGETFDVPRRPDMEDDLPRSLGYHDPEGMLIIAGPGVVRGTTLGSSVYDIAPTLLCHLGIPIPSDVDGCILDDAFEYLPEPRYVDRHPTPTMERALTAGEEADIEEQLRDLGYIE